MKSWKSASATIGLVATSLIAVSRAEAAPTIIMECAEPKGQSFFSVEGKWDKDGMTGGKIALLRGADGKLDIRIKDATGSEFTVTGDGATVVPLLDGDNEWAVLAVYPLNVTETYVFDASGGQVRWTQQRYGVSQFHKVSAMVAFCGN